MTTEPTTLVIPGAEPAPIQPGLSLPLPTIIGTVVVGAAAWAVLAGRRRGKVDPRELAFRRIARAQGWSRGQVRALRRAAAGLGLGSPVGLALSPTLTARVLGGKDAQSAR